MELNLKVWLKLLPEYPVMLSAERGLDITQQKSALRRSLLKKVYKTFY